MNYNKQDTVWTVTLNETDRRDAWEVRRGDRRMVTLKDYPLAYDIVERVNEAGKRARAII
jgi:hypothetical protein